MNSSLMDKSIWVLEDDEGCRFVYEQTLDHRYKTRYFTGIADFEKAITDDANVKPDLIVADLMLDDGNFLNFLTSSHDTKIFNLPFIIVSSIDDVDALRFCFKEGALDYLTKPFKKNEIVVKIENILSGSNRQAPAVEAGKSLELDGKAIENLTSKQKQLLRLFINSSTRVVSREDILTNVWGSTNVHPKTVDVHLYNLRRKLHSHGYLIRSEGGGKWSLLSDRIDEAV